MSFKILLNKEPDNWQDKSHVFKETFQKVDSNKVFYIAESLVENFTNTDFLRLKTFADFENIKIVSIGDLNRYPLYSLISHEAIMTKNFKSNIYSKGNSTTSLDLKEIKEVHKPTAIKDISKKMYSIKWQDIVEHFKNQTIKIRKSSYETYKNNESLINSNEIICEIKQQSKHALKELNNYDLINKKSINYSFQNKLMSAVGKDHYLSTQILAANTKKISYICIGGSLNILGLLPIPILLGTDHSINKDGVEIYKNICYENYGYVPEIYTHHHRSEELKQKIYHLNFCPKINYPNIVVKNKYLV